MDNSSQLYCYTTILLFCKCDLFNIASVHNIGVYTVVVNKIVQLMNYIQKSKVDKYVFSNSFLSDYFSIHTVIGINCCIVFIFKYT